MKKVIILILTSLFFTFSIAASEYTLKDKIQNEIKEYNQKNEINIIYKDLIVSNDNYVFKNISFLDKSLKAKLPITIDEVIFNKESFEFYLKAKNNPSIEFNNSVISEYKRINVNLKESKMYLLLLKKNKDYDLSETDYNDTMEMINMVQDFSESNNLIGNILFNVYSTDENYKLSFNANFPKLSFFDLNIETTFEKNKNKNLETLKIDKISLINDVLFNLGKSKKYYKESEWNELVKQSNGIDFLETYLQAINENKKYRLEFKLLEPVNVAELFNNIMQTVMTADPESIENGTIKKDIDKLFKYELKTKIYE